MFVVRHLENINVDTTTGQSFHVDMNSLFNISETYKVNVFVPFVLKFYISFLSIKYVDFCISK